jgi:hypothetical protein
LAAAQAVLNGSGEHAAVSDVELIDDEVMDLLVAEWLVGRSKAHT